MPSHLRRFVESIVYAGMRPSGVKAPTRSLRWLGPLAGPIDRFLSGSRPTDPLYLSNQTAVQKVRRAALVAAPVLAVAAIMAAVAIMKIPARTKPERELTPGEVAARILPNLSKDIALNVNNDIQVLEVSVKPGSPQTVTGSARNNTDRPVSAAELVFDLTDSSGSQVGAVNTTVRNLPAKSSVAFQFPIKQQDAAFVLVRETHIE